MELSAIRNIGRYFHNCVDMSQILRLLTDKIDDINQNFYTENTINKSQN